MSNQAERRMVLTVGEEITRVKPNGDSQDFEKLFPIVDIEGLSLEESFMQYEPQTDNERRIKASIIKAKEIGMKNFRIPAIDPSFDDDDGETIIYCSGRKPAVGRSANWWYENAPKFMPGKNSRLRDELEHDIVLGIMLIKHLVEEQGYEVEKAWAVVCVDSKGLCIDGNKKSAIHEFETTGSRQIGKCFDWGNTSKIVKKHGNSLLMLFGGCYDYHYAFNFPLANADIIDYPYRGRSSSVGELVLDV